MRGRLDENMPVESVDFLRAAGWECDTVIGEGLGGAQDPDLGARCQAEGRVLFTLDMDFADIRAYPPSEHVGIVVFRPVKPSLDSVLRLLQQLMPVLNSEWAERRLWIVSLVACVFARVGDRQSNSGCTRRRRGEPVDSKFQ